MAGPEQEPFAPDALTASVTARVREVMAEAEAAAERLRREVEEATVRRAAEVRTAAEEEAERIRRTAEQQAEAYLAEARRRADAHVAQRVERLADLTDGLLARAEALSVQLDAAGEARRAVEELVVAVRDAARAALEDTGAPPDAPAPMVRPVRRGERPRAVPDLPLKEEL
ncbi:hypothetical protein [Conexibacter sp. SYSU D00693]|uniref:hypothetical protein n=1 Tax=Conexibacter sp. SYSU D00693 TaxID=2812560 RepID=UPI00196B9DAB|nr:hypothetical protein [Conexibacter sp. SYSU D00693]